MIAISRVLRPVVTGAVWHVISDKREVFTHVNARRQISDSVSDE